MQNPWKLSTLVLAAALMISNARASSDWRKDAIAHLESAAAILEQHGATGKEEPTKKTSSASPNGKALQLTRAAIVQMKRASE